MWLYSIMVFICILIIAKDKYFIYLKCYWKINPPLRKILWYFYEEEYGICSKALLKSNIISLSVTLIISLVIL